MRILDTGARRISSPLAGDEERVEGTEGEGEDVGDMVREGIES